jgi:hypothetical protein
MLDVIVMLVGALQCGWLQHRIQERMALASKALHTRSSSRNVMHSAALVPASAGLYFGVFESR